MSKLDKNKITNIKFENINLKDYPDFSDAYIISALYEGRPMTEEELEEINKDGEYIYSLVIDSIF